MVMSDTLRAPGQGAGIVRIHGTERAIAFTSDVTPRYVRANPRQGGRQAVAEAYRNLTAAGARPLAATDNLNFGNPEKPEIMGQLVGAILGIGEACRALEVPIVSGNVSLYNETDGQPILPTPTIGAVGLLEHLSDAIGTRPEPGDLAVVIGRTEGHLGCSALLWEMWRREDGDAPPVDLEAERRNGEFLRAHRGLVRAATDLSDGGLALAGFEMAATAGVGLELEAGDLPTLFGEDQARYLLACAPDQVAALETAAQAAGVPLVRVGRFGGDRVRLGPASAPLAELDALWRRALPAALGEG